MRRRDFFTLVGGAVAWPLAARAQRPDRVWRIGILSFGPPGSPNDLAFRQGLRDLGYIEGQNLVVEHREYGSRREELADLAAELVKLKVDAIFASGSEATLAAARQAPASVPIVFTSTDPLGLSFVASLARPGANVTGLSLMGPDLSGKRLQFAAGDRPRHCKGLAALGPERPGRRFLAEGNASRRRSTVDEGPGPGNTTQRRL